MAHLRPLLPSVPVTSGEGNGDNGCASARGHVVTWLLCHHKGQPGLTGSDAASRLPAHQKIRLAPEFPSRGGLLP